MGLSTSRENAMSVEDDSGSPEEVTARAQVAVGLAEIVTTTADAPWVAALVEIARDHQLVLYADTKRPFELADLPPGVELRLLPWQGALSSVYHDLCMRRVMALDRLDIVHFPGNYGFGPRGVRTVVTLHDALNIWPLSEILVRSVLRGQTKTLRTAAMTAYLHFCSTAAVRRSDLILTVSEHARQEIARYARISSRKIVAASWKRCRSLVSSTIGWPSITGFRV